MRALPVVLVCLAACTQPPAGAQDTPAAPSRPAPSRPAPPARATAAGLSPTQAQQLAVLGVPVAVPAVPDGWTVADVTAARNDGFPTYAIVYRSPDGACLTVEGATEGVGGVFVTEPPSRLDVEVPFLATAGPVPLGWSGGTFGTSEGWEDARVQSEWLGVDGVAVQVRSTGGTGCTVARPEVVADVVASLRALDPLDDGPLGVWAPAEGQGSGATPEAAALAAFGPTEPTEGRQATAAETVNARAAHAVVVVTTTDVADDSVRDERLRVVVVRTPGVDMWEVVQAGQQVRCQAGRGHTDWSAAPCL